MSKVTGLTKTPHKVDVAVGERLKQLRTMRGMSQSDVAKELGISFQQIQKYEMGVNRTSASRLYDLAQVLEVTPADFFAEITLDTTPHKQDEIQTTVLRMVEGLLRPLSDEDRTAFVKNVVNLAKSL